MTNRFGPDQVMSHFFKSLLQYHFPVCWSLFSNRTKQTFMDFTLKELYRSHGKSAEKVKLGLPEIKFMFENNDTSLIKLFWRRFVIKSSANDFCHYATFQTDSINGKEAQVLASVNYPDGRVVTIRLEMLYEFGGWKFGYFESGFKIE